MKFEKDSGYGHTLDLGNGHHVSHDSETGEHHVINHAKQGPQDQVVSTHKTAHAAIVAGRGMNGDKSGNPDHPAVKAYKAATSMEKSHTVVESGMHKIAIPNYKPLNDAAKQAKMSTAQQMGTKFHKDENDMNETGDLAQVEKHDLTAQGREHIKGKNFAEPKQKKYPIEDRTHARNALARVAQNGSPSEKKAVDAKVHAKYPGIDKSDADSALMMSESEGWRDEGDHRGNGYSHPVHGDILPAKNGRGYKAIHPMGDESHHPTTGAAKKHLEGVSAEMHSAGFGKSEKNPDEKQDAEMGEAMEHMVADHIAKDPKDHGDEIHEIKSATSGMHKVEYKKIKGHGRLGVEFNPSLPHREGYPKSAKEQSDRLAAEHARMGEQAKKGKK
jgi:hypothetical protein